MRAKVRWTDARVMYEILHTHSRGENIASNSVRKNNYSLVREAVARFGSWNKALSACGIKPVMLMSRWTKESVINTVIGLLSDGCPFVSDELNKREPGIKSAISLHVGGMILLKQEIGICTLSDKPKPVVIPYIRPDYKQALLDEILTRQREGLPLNYDAIRNTGLRSRARTHFGGWRSAIEAAGLSYDDVRIDTDTASYYGYALEALFGEVLTELNVRYTQYEHERYDPDYVLDNDRWIDVKLSEWTVSSHHSETLERYEPHCKSLTIVFLRGDKTCDRMLTPKTRLVNVSHYVKQLPRVRQRYYNAKLRDIESSVA
jgi:hypothetical protein